VRFAGAFLLLAALWAVPSVPAAAQSANEVNAARRLYRQGVRHTRAGHWQRAREAFEQSLSIVERPSTMLNLAGALVETGAMVEGAEMYRRYLSAATDDRHRAQAQNLLDDLEERMPKMTLEVTGLGDGDRLELDGEELGTGVVGLPVPVDPGVHEVAVRRDGDTVAVTEFELGEREQETVALVAPPPPEPVNLMPDSLPEEHEEADSGGGVLSSPWFWIVTLLLVGGGVAVGVYFATSDTGPDAHMGNVGMGRIGI